HFWSHPRLPLFPYTTLFRSTVGWERSGRDGRRSVWPPGRSSTETTPHSCIQGPATPSSWPPGLSVTGPGDSTTAWLEWFSRMERDRKSTRLNSSHDQISYAV